MRGGSSDGREEQSGARRLRVLHVITRLIVGGAQENTILSCALADPSRFESEIVCGIETGPEGDLFGMARAHGVSLTFEPTLVRDPSPRDSVALGRLVAHMRHGRYDVIHTHSAKAGILGRIAARMIGVKGVVNTVHGWSFHDRQKSIARNFYAGLERLCARLCDVMIVVAERDRADGLALGIGRADQYRLVRSGIEIERYRDVDLSPAAARARCGLPPHAFVVGSVGRLSLQKAPLDLVRAFDVLARVRPDAHLLVLGDGPLRAEVEREVERLNLRGRVHLPGIRADVPELLRAMDIFALSSHWEGLPRVFPQAMCAALPIVATRVDGAAEAIEEGENGFLVEAGDIARLGERLVLLAENADLRRRLGAKGLGRVEEFSAGRMVRQLEAIYEAVVAGRPVPPDPRVAVSATFN
jgi:glycosyltransferase involved in cell wall biosynthesis